MEEEGGGKVNWIWNKGVALGKGILVTGVVISSAPFVLPPFLVFSAIGFACAVPCGLYLASYACTEKLMSKLLPGTQPPRFLLDSEKRDYDNGVIEKGHGEDLESNTKHGIKRRFDVLDEDNEEQKGVTNGVAYHYEQELEGNTSGVLEANGYDEDAGEYVDHEKQTPTEEEIDASREEEKQVPVAVKRESRAPESEAQGLMIVIEGEEVIGTGVKEDAPLEVTSVAIELCEGQDSAANEELEREARKLMEDIIDDGEVDKIKDNQGGVFINNGAEEDATENIKEDRKTGVDNATMLEEQTRDDSSKDTKEETSAEYKLPEESKHVSSSEHSPTSVKGIDGEDKIRNQLNAMRTIVGCTASPRASCVEELKALYIFTGVEPPESLNNPLDLAEVGDKLRFLMSIVGVK